MKKYLMSLSAAFGLLLMVSSISHASVGVRSPKASFNNGYTVTVTTITTVPGAVYQVILSTGAAGDYCALFDLTASGTTGSTNSSFKTRIYYSSTTANTVVTFDPPLIFFNGIFVGNSAATDTSCLVTYEEGRGLSGQ